METKTNEERINGSGLFFFKSSLSIDKKIEILDWVDSLTEKQRDFIDTLRSETYHDCAYFTSCE